MKRIAATVVVIAAFAVPAQALAAPTLAAPLPGAKPAQGGTTTSATATPTHLRPTLNNNSDRKALNAYATYLTTLIAQQPIGQLNDSSYIATISGSGGCKATLAPLTQPPYQVNTVVQHTLTVLGQEIGDDITLNFDLAATEAFTKFSITLKALHWSRVSGAGLVIKRYVNAQTNMLAMTVSNLCLDATNAALHPELVPDDTKAFIKAYDRAASQANLALTNLMTLMQTYEMPGEKALVARISTLATQLSAQTKAQLLQSGTTLTGVLESAS